MAMGLMALIRGMVLPDTHFVHPCIATNSKAVARSRRLICLYPAPKGYFDLFPAKNPQPLEPSKNPKSYQPPELLTA